MLVSSQEFKWFLTLNFKSDFGISFILVLTKKKEWKQNISEVLKPKYVILCYIFYCDGFFIFKDSN